MDIKAEVMPFERKTTDIGVSISQGILLMNDGILLPQLLLLTMMNSRSTRAYSTLSVTGIARKSQRVW